MVSSNEKMAWVGLLAVQNTVLGLLLCQVRGTERTSLDESGVYNIPGAVLLAEISKLGISVLVCLGKAYHDGPTEDEEVGAIKNRSVVYRCLNAGLNVRRDVLGLEAWTLAVPACLYVIENNLQQVAAKNLDFTSFQFISNARVLTTAVFSVLLLKKRLNLKRWIAVILLAAGVGLAQDASFGAGTASFLGSQSMGVLTAAMACVLSGLAGVCFETAVKSANVSVWTINARLSLFATLAATIPFLHQQVFTAYPPPSITSLFQFGSWIWLVILCQVIGGFAVAKVVKQTDAIVKGYIQSVALVGVLVVVDVTPQYLCGALLVAISAFLYHSVHRPHIHLQEMVQPRAAFSVLPPPTPYYEDSEYSTTSTPESSPLYTATFASEKSPRPERSALEALRAEPYSSPIDNQGSEESHFLLSGTYTAPKVTRRVQVGEPTTPEALTFNEVQLSLYRA